MYVVIILNWRLNIMIKNETVKRTFLKQLYTKGAEEYRGTDKQYINKLKKTHR